MRHIPLVGDVAAGTDVLAQQNVEELLPMPVDFTGEGDLFMLRVRGDSMIEAGILDGDFVVARQQDTATNGDIVIAGIPAKRGNGQDLPAQGRRRHAAARQQPAVPDGLPRRRGADLRQGRHGDAPALSAGEPTSAQLLLRRSAPCWWRRCSGLWTGGRLWRTLTGGGEYTGAARIGARSHPPERTPPASGDRSRGRRHRLAPGSEHDEQQTEHQTCRRRR